VEYNGPTATTLNSREVEREITRNYYFGRIDYSPWDRLQLFASFIGSPVRTEGPPVLPGGLLNETTNPGVFNNDRYQFKGGYAPSWNLATSATWNATDALIFSLRGGRTYLNDKGTSYDIPVGQPLFVLSVPCTDAAGFPCPSGSQGAVASFPGIQDNFAALFNITTRTNINADATYVTRFFDQQHIIKGGYQLNRLSNKVDEAQQGGIINLYFDRQYDPNDPESRGEFGYYRVTDFGTKGDVSSRSQAFFLQDAWTVHPRLTLNLGIRFEDEFLPTYPIDATFHPTIDPEQLAGAPDKPIAFGWGDKIAPRIGVAWDVMGDQRLKVYGSFGVFYDTMKYELPRGSFGGDRFIRTWYAIYTP
jgi:hypothetical protein